METIVRKYKGLHVVVKKEVCGLEDVNREIQYLLAQHPVSIEKEGPLKNGDTAVIDFEGFKDGVAFEGGKGVGFHLTIGSHTFIPGFEEQMVGMQIGESRDLHLSFPENYGAADLAGAAVVFKVTLFKIVDEKPAELTDEFAESLKLKGVHNVEDLRQYASAAMQSELDKRYETEKKEGLFRELLKYTQAEPDKDLLDRIAKGQMEAFMEQIKQQGLTLEQYLAYVGESADAFENEAYLHAEEQLKLQLAFDWIADQEQLTVDDYDIEVGYTELAKRYQVTLAEVKKNIKPENVAKDLKMARAIEIVMDAAEFTEN